MSVMLSALLEGIAAVPPEYDRAVTGLTLDSREIRPGDVFLALKGASMDARRFIGTAISAGAGAIVYEAGDGYTLPKTAAPAFGVKDLRGMLGAIADRFFDSPSRRMTVVGVTGTNGKTTCTQLLAQAYGDDSRRCAVIGTLGAGFSGALKESVHTTPDAIAVHRLMREFLDAGAASVAMEVSSHALDQGRVNEVAFDCVVFTNLTRDHLDYHGNMRAYGGAKARLFEWPTLRHAVINRDDDFGRELLEKIESRVHTLSYGLDGGDVTARAVRPTGEGLALDIVTPFGAAELHAPLFGRFNAYNVLAVLATLLALDVPLSDAVERLSGAQPAAGRVERFGGGEHPWVIVDYAHTPDALEKVLSSLREHTSGKLICVFGCGGDRDRGKRPLMGAIAERLADEVILTDDNPRTEPGAQIIDEIRSGMKREAPIVRDRTQAIAQAIGIARAGDIVLVAGKGHENYQQIGSNRVPYSDRDTVRKLLGGAP